MEIIFAVVIAVVGWIVNHLFTLSAQKKTFYNTLQNEARISLTSALHKYLDWIDEIKQSYNLISSFWETLDSPLKTRIDMIKFSEDFRRCVQKQTLRLFCYDLLEEYEPLFPQTVEARDHLRKNHASIIVEIKKYQ